MIEQTIGEAMTLISSQLAEAGIENPRLDARMLVAFTLEVDTSRILSHPEEEIEAEDQELLNELVARRIKHEPLALIVGEKGFWTQVFRVTKDTLIPRPDTETLVEVAIEYLEKDESNDVRVLDLGTGSGCILLSVLDGVGWATGVGVDINEKAVEIAQENAHWTELVARSEFVHGNWTEGLAEQYPEKFSMVVSNPPYIPDADVDNLMPDVALYEPHLALRGGEDGLDCYRTLSTSVGELLNEDGLFICEIGRGQQDDVAELFIKQGFELLETRKDLAGIIRCLVFKVKNPD